MHRDERPPEELVVELRDALSHLYDRSYLLKHPLVRLLKGEQSSDGRRARSSWGNPDRGDRAHRGLRTPESDAAWRPYRVLHSRYVLGHSIDEIERDMALGTRQVQRELRRGLQLVAAALSGRSRSEHPPGQPIGHTLANELTRIASEDRVVDISDTLRNAVLLVLPLAEKCSVRLADARLPQGVKLVGDEDILRQVAVAALSHMVRSAPGASLSVSAHWTDTRISVVLRSRDALIGAMPDPSSRLPPTLLALLEVLGGRASLVHRESDLTLSIVFPRENQERVVALVEDNETVIELFSRYVSGHGWRLVGITDSTTALAEQRLLRPDAVVLDLMMRRTDGWAVLRQIRSDAQLAEIPIAVCSVLAEPELARVLGADEYLVKPVRPMQLRQCLDRLAARGRSMVAMPQ